MEALVLEPNLKLSLRDVVLDEPLGAADVRIRLHTVGVCGSDVHYYTHGRIGPYVVNEPMVLGHEAAGTIVEAGSAVKHLKSGDCVCMEPGIPDPNSRPSRLGMYNLDPAMRFWATPPVHGVLRESVVHPAAFTFRLPPNVTFAEGAMVEPLSVGMHAASKARIKPGDVALVIGAGPIGMVTALAALAAGCVKVIITDIVQPKLDLAAKLHDAIIAVNVARSGAKECVNDQTEGWGVDKIFECSGNIRAAKTIFDPLCPGGTVVWVGMPLEPIAFDIVAAQVKEARIETVFRYAHVYPRALGLMGSGAIDVKPLITDTFTFSDAVQAFNFAKAMPATSVKVQITLPS